MKSEASGPQKTINWSWRIFKTFWMWVEASEPYLIFCPFMRILWINCYLENMFSRFSVDKIKNDTSRFIAYISLSVILINLINGLSETVPQRLSASENFYFELTINHDKPHMQSYNANLISNLKPCTLPS